MTETWHALTHNPRLVLQFGKMVRQLRMARGWSQETLAEMSDLNRTYIGEIERGQVAVSLTTIEKLACAFRLPVHEMFLQTSLTSTLPERAAKSTATKTAR